MEPPPSFSARRARSSRGESLRAGCGPRAALASFSSRRLRPTFVHPPPSATAKRRPSTSSGRTTAAGSASNRPARWTGLKSVAFLGHAPGNSTSMGVALLQAFDVPPERDWYWIGVGALVGFTVLLNVLFTISLQYLNPIGKPKAIISEEEASTSVSEHEPKEMKQRAGKSFNGSEAVAGKELNGVYIIFFMWMCI
ncbi:hypothetical protein Drorol1_Dr00011972 [Drosera rotundifolia]